ncbi:MAG TPA: ribonuclease H-like domain-containing protein [Vicinamibacterales bacterium]|nr:ribonuclease H-like domain-containing protein [Vicinamibacterales bacterium]HPW19924.1 ribonuclease H-like domain-containing protein [Vicinamibacterales bacterium]
MSTDPSRLSSRLRELLRNAPPRFGGRGDAAEAAGPRQPSAPGRGLVYAPEDAPSGRGGAGGAGCAVIERQYAGERLHGRRRVAEYGEMLARCMPGLAVLAADDRAAAPREPRRERLQWDGGARLAESRRRAGAPSGGPLLFFDLETTGLSGGAGTLAFLAGCGSFDQDGFHTRQLFLSGCENERELLDRLAGMAGRCGGLVTFNGRAFDVPLIETRYAFHRLESPFSGLPHFDLLHPARRLWRRRGLPGPSHRDRRAGGRPGDAASCALGALEEAILGLARLDDVPGAEIPSRYFGYLRTGDLGPLEPVFEHNRLDLLSLAALTAIAAQLAVEGPSGTASPHEALAMGRIYQQLGREDEADACFSRASGLGGAPWEADAVDAGVRADALRALARGRRRRRRYAEAADAWERLLASGASLAFAQEAREALAIHHEHRARNLAAARELAVRALAAERDPGAAAGLRRRLARIDRKIGASGARRGGGD